MISLSECCRGRQSNAPRGTSSDVTLLAWPGEVAVCAARLDEPTLDRASRRESKRRLVGFLCGMFDTHRAGKGDLAESDYTGIHACTSHRLPPSCFPSPPPFPLPEGGRVLRFSRSTGEERRLREISRPEEEGRARRAMGAACNADHCEVVRDALGKPILMVRGRPGPSVSFASLGGTTWAAMTRTRSSVGIDAAWSGEFGPGYPIQRAFHKEEFDFGLSRTRGERKEAAGLLWSVKEAVVKSLGCGFHLLDPLDLSVGEWQRDRKKSAFQVVLVNGAGRKLGMVEDEPIAVCTFREGEVWLSVAVVEKPRPIEASIDALITGRRLGSPWGVLVASPAHKQQREG